MIFGAGGDLTRRLLMPSLYNLDEDRLLPEQFAVVGFARTEVEEQTLREDFRRSIRESVDPPVDETRLEWLLSRFSYIRADFGEPSGWNQLVAKLGELDREARTAGNCLFHLATGPDQFLEVCERLAERGLLKEASGGFRRIVVEKPFGRDVESAHALNERLRELMNERQIYRIDHYLGKETVQNILVFRFGNGIFEPVWNRRYIDHVQITVAETLGVETRGAYYDQTGALRDMVPNHLFQLLTFTAMEPPSSFSATALHNEQVKVLDAVEPLTANDCGTTTLRARYEAGMMDEQAVQGYREEPRVSPSSATETYAAFRLSVDNWRWAGVPFYLRTGKRLAAKRSEVVIQFRDPPLALFRHASVELPVAANRLVLSIQPEESISLELAAKMPGPSIVIEPVHMRFKYADYFGIDRQTGYETLLYDAMTGDRTLFKRSDMIDRGWAIVQPILDAWQAGACGLATYRAGTDGPREADELMRRDGRAWRTLR
ncbi:MAG: glucose-6-phosphate dehydrogenase [Vicinamibacterales bacterium]